MRKIRALAAAFCLAVATVMTIPAHSAQDSPDSMPVSELREGMKGYGLTVFNGTEPERFEAEIIGVMRSGIGPGVDMILARLDHPLLTDISVVAGMSGSPVFIDDRIIGAVGYGFTFSKKAIAGITPIERMLDVYEKTDREPPPRDIALGPVEDVTPGEPVSLAPKMDIFHREPVRIQSEEFTESMRALFEGEPDDMVLEPLAMPLLVSSCSPRTARAIEEIFKPLGMEPIFTPVGSNAAAMEGNEDIPIQNGTAMGIPYILGDLTMGGIGTVTYLRDDKLVAFGHPMSARGPVVFPMGVARILSIVPSRQRPVKLGEIVNVAGSVHQDRLPAIGCIVGKTPFMVPMKVTVINEPAGSEKTYEYRLIDHRIFTPRMALIALLESMSAGDRTEGEMTASIEYAIETDDGRRLEKRAMGTGTMAPSEVASNLLSDLSPIYSNSFDIHSVRDISATVRIRDKIEAASIRSAYADREIYKPGQTARVSVYVKPFRQPEERVTLDFQIPPETEDGRYNLVVGDAQTRQSAEVVRAPGLYQPRDFADVVQLLRLHFLPNRLYLMMTDAERGYTIHGEEFGSLPPSISWTIGDLQNQEYIVPTIGRILAQSDREMPYVVQGSHIARIQVDRHGGR